MNRKKPHPNREDHNIRIQTAIALHQKNVRQAVQQAFNQWDQIVVTRLTQLGETLISPKKRAWDSDWRGPVPNVNLLRRIFHKQAKSRVYKDRNEYWWRLELPGGGAPGFPWHHLVQVRFILDDCDFPSGFFFCRMADNKFFQTTSLSEEEFARTLLAHFGHASCGSGKDGDIAWLDSLHQKQLLSPIEYQLEKKNTLAGNIAPAVYTAPREPPHKAPWGLYFFIFCVAVVVAIVVAIVVYTKI